jgi:hypothetical protein
LSQALKMVYSKTFWFSTQEEAERMEPLILDFINPKPVEQEEVIEESEE